MRRSPKWTGVVGERTSWWRREVDIMGVGTVYTLVCAKSGVRTPCTCLKARWNQLGFPVAIEANFVPASCIAGMPSRCILTRANHWLRCTVTRLFCLMKPGRGFASSRLIWILKAIHLPSNFEPSFTPGPHRETVTLLCGTILRTLFILKSRRNSSRRSGPTAFFAAVLLLSRRNRLILSLSAIGQGIELI